MVMGILLLLLAAVSYALTYYFSGSDFEEIPYDVGPNFLPRVLLLALGELIFMLWLLILGWRKQVS